MKTQQWGFPFGDVEAYVDVPPGHVRNKFIVIGDELNHVAYIPAIHPEAKEIAFLVKAAPDLLAALEECRYALGKANDQYKADKGKRSQVLDSRIRQAEDAIAKARGEA